MVVLVDALKRLPAAATLTLSQISIIRIRQSDEARMAPQALRFPRRIVSLPKQQQLLQDDEVWLRQQSAPLLQACEATTRAQSARAESLAPWQFLPGDLQPICPLPQFQNKVFCRTH